MTSTLGPERSRRTRSRRGAKPAVETPVKAAPVAEAVAAPIVVEAEARDPRESREPREPRRERGRGRDRDRPRNSEPRENATPEIAAEDTRAGNGRPFGEADIPAFLRRPVTIKS